MIQYVIWGAGNRGKDIVNALGRERVIAVVDRNKELHSSLFRGINVISPEQYYADYSTYPIFVTPEGYESEIAGELQSKGIDWYFLYGEEFSQTETFMKQAPIEELIRDYNIAQCQYVYGFSLMGLLLYDYLSDSGYNCKLILQSGKSAKLQDYIENVLSIALADFSEATECIHLSIPLDKNDSSKLCCKYDSFYDLIDKDIFYNPKIEQFKNLHKGKRCFIIGTGPSLKTEDLDILMENNEICISMNGIYKGFHKTNWRPDYYVVSDLDAVYYGKDDILKMDVKNKFIADVAWDFEEDTENMYKWHLIRKWEDGKLPEFTEDFSRGSYAGRTITYDGGLQLAAYMGFKEIYLLGIDCCNYNDKATAHFFDKLGTGRKEEKGYLQIEANLLAYMAARKYSEEHDFTIYNATRGGKLEIFERVDFDKLFA